MIELMLGIIIVLLWLIFTQLGQTHTSHWKGIRDIVEAINAANDS